MKKMITITGLKYYFGPFPFKKGQKILLVKEPENKHDREAIRAEISGLGKVGYVANSSFTVLGECMSAGRLYDKIGNTARARVKIVLPDAVICKVLKDKTTAGSLTPPEEIPAQAPDEVFLPDAQTNI